MTSTTQPAASAAPQVRTARRARREWPGRLATILGLLLGIVVILFPVAGTYYNNWHVYEIARQQMARSPITQGGSASKAALAAAHDYNAHLDGSLLADPWGAEPPQGSPAYKRYENLLGGSSSVIGALRLPTIKSELPIYHGTTDWSLDRGAGHMYGTALPVGGAGTHAALAAHRGLPELTGFDRLPEVKAGDQFFVDVAGETLAYQVTRTDTVLPTDLALLKPVKGKDLVTLITCTPYGINTHRLLVTGTRIPWSQVDKAQAGWHGFDWTIQSWMYLRVGAAIATLLVLLWLLVAWRRDDRRRARRLAAKRAAAQAAAQEATA